MHTTSPSSHESLMRWLRRHAIAIVVLLVLLTTVASVGALRAMS